MALTDTAVRQAKPSGKNHTLTPIGIAVRDGTLAGS